MCGIFGVSGGAPAAPIIAAGLKKLEYRGYDSSGIALSGEKGIWLCKCSGNLARLEKKLASSPPPQASVGIGHTRWATHGEATDLNAHPFLSRNGAFAAVHNGIIENYASLKTFLADKGFVLQSDTDSEVVPMLLEYFYDGDVVKAVLNTLSALEGAYALAIVSSYAPDCIFAARKDSALSIGTAGGASFVSSDVPALGGLAERSCTMPEQSVAVLRKGEILLFDGNGRKTVTRLFPLPSNNDDADKGAFPHFMLKEIFSQPRCLADAAAPFLDGRLLKNELFSDEEAKGFNRVKLIGCGSAFHAGVAGKYFIERLAALPAEAELAGEFRYRDALSDKNTLTVFVSQSGETADTLLALRHAKDRGSPTLAVVNTPLSSIASEADKTVHTRAGTEIAVATTKGYTTQVLCLFAVALLLGKARGTLPAPEESYVQALLELPQAVESVLGLNDRLKAAAKAMCGAQSVFFIGRGDDYAAAMEGALKLKEISYINANAYAAGELKHGTISLVETGTPVVALATDKSLFRKTASNIEEVKARGADTLLLTTAEASACCKSSRLENTILLPHCRELGMIPASVALQLLAYHAADSLGRDVDKPRNLAKSVTVE